MKDPETELHCPSNIAKHQVWDDIYLIDLPLPNMYPDEIYPLVTVNHAGFDDVKKNLFDNECHHQNGGEYESCRF